MLEIAITNTFDLGENPPTLSSVRKVAGAGVQCWLLSISGYLGTDGKPANELSVATQS